MSLPSVSSPRKLFSRASFRQKDFLAGLLFILIAAVVTFEGAGLAQGSAERMGPGYLPLRLGIMLGALGLVIAMNGLHGEDDPLPVFAPYPILAGTAGLLAFGFAIESAGLIPASALLVLAARAISWRGRKFELALLVLALSAIVVVVFRYGLGLPVDLLPGWGD